MTDEITGSIEDTVTTLVTTLVVSVRSLGEAGRAEEASRLAATAWSATRREFPNQARRINGVMHYLAAQFPIAGRSDDQPVDGEHSTNPPIPKENTMPAPDQLLDVRSEAPARRHELIFETYHGLDGGEGFVLVNDHDPKPLYYQFAAEHADQFTWDYLEQGPETWRVRIGRTA